jgi:hypothetical protein
MRTGKQRESTRKWFQWLATVALVLGIAGACKSDPSEPVTVGSIQANVTTTGSDPDPDGYTVLVDGAGGQAVGVNGSVVFSDVQQGDHQVSIQGLAANCSVSGSNPQTVSVVAGQTTQASIAVTCVALVGDLTITTTTTGSDPDADGYTYSVDGGTPAAIAVNDMVTVSVAAGTRSVQLAGLAPNCTVTGSNPRSVNVPIGGAASADFVVTCSSTAGTLVITTSTTGTDPDADGYAVTVDGGAPQAIGSNAVLTLNGVTAGDRQVQLGGFASNCTVSGLNPRTVTVSPSSGVQTDFAITCEPIVGDVEVLTSTTGVDPDPDGFSLVVEGKSAVLIGVVDTVVVAGVHFGDRQVELQDLASNCSVVNGTNPRTLTVPADDTVSTTFVVACVALEGNVTVTASTTGSDLDPDGYTVSVDGGAGQPISTNGAISLDLPTGDHTLLLSDIAPNCTVTGDNPAMITVPVGGTSHTFDVSCVLLVGDVEVTTSTTGSDLDADGYTVTVEGEAPVSIGTTAMITVSNVSAGDRTVELTGVAANCTVAGLNPRTVTVTDGGTVPTTFNISCEAALSNQIVFDSDRGLNADENIWVMNPDGNGLQQLTTNLADDTEPYVSPLGTRIAFVSDRDGDGEVYIMDADGTGQTNLTSNGARDREPAFSPDGTKIVFTSDRDGDDDIYVMDVDGSNVEQLTNVAGRDGLPDWSPDGSKIVFRSDRDGDTEIYVMNSDGSGPQRLTTSAGNDFAPSWSPDGTKIAFTSLRDGNREVYVMDANGSNPTRLTTDLGEDVAPQWSPDGSQLVFSSDRDGNREVYVMDANGSSQVNITNDAARDFETSWSRVP